MSDTSTDIRELYEKDVLSRHYPRHIGLFSIPEYPEGEGAGRGMWSAAVHAILNTLRYLAPATLLTLFWGEQSLLFRILRHIDSAVRSLAYSSDEQKASVLKWLAESGAVRVEHLDTVWRHGWILCGVLDAAVPGACAGHPPNRLSLKHAQTIADHYLGVDPVFTNEELEASNCLSKHQEWKLAQYLDRIREALGKLPPPVSKPNSQSTSPTETHQFTFDYAARGSGLTAAQVNSKMYFKVYPTAQQSLEPGEITILIRGPKDTYGMAVAPPVLGRAQMIRQKLLNLQTKANLTKNVLPITHGAAYLRSYGRNDMKKTYHIPKTKYDIEVEIETRDDSIKVGYTVSHEGKYEISIVSRGLSIVGSPFHVTASHNILGILERESFCLEDGEEIDIVDVKTDRKAVLRIVDFVTEKMLLKEDGVLERISDDDANLLMATKDNEKKIQKSDLSNKSETKTYFARNMRFIKIVSKIISMNKVCVAFKAVKKMSQTNIDGNDEGLVIRPHSRCGIPDVVNSTFNESYLTFSKHDAYDHEANLPSSSNVKNNIKLFTDISKQTHEKPSLRNNKSGSLDSSFNEGAIAYTEKTSPNNPFMQHLYEQSYITEQVIGSQFMEEESDQPFAEIDDLNDIPIQIIIDEDNESISPCTNPFMEQDMIERPKTPVLKIITGEVTDRADDLYVDPRIYKLQEEIFQNNEFINPLFVHQHSQSPESPDDENIEARPLAADFKIGAPVSLPPIIRAASPKHMDSLLITSDSTDFYTFENNNETDKPEEISPSVFSTPVHNKVDLNAAISSTFHSLESIKEINEDIVLADNENNFNQCEIEVYNYKMDIETPKRDMWDSAYVSIDENMTSPDNNNNDNETSSKSKFSLSDGASLKRDELLNMGPAEFELWTTCVELTTDAPKVNEDLKALKFESKRPIFTPIIEESDGTVSVTGKHQLKTSDSTDPVTVAFAELNDIFQEYTSNSEQSSLTITYDDKIGQSSELEYPIDDKDIRVDSASDCTADVIRPANNNKEGAISEVQTNVTESGSASHSLPQESDHEHCESTVIQIKTQTEFGETIQANLVLEKKKYWDEKIRQIEEIKAEEPKRKRLISKNLRHNDSLSKRRGKQMVKQFLVSNETKLITSRHLNDEQKFKQSFEEQQADPKLVEKWKNFWNEKLEAERDVNQGNFVTNVSRLTDYSSESPSPTPPERSETEIEIADHNKNKKDSGNKTPILPVKQELPEEVFKAFETSPKRFFGTSRKQILNKIDSFLGKEGTAKDTLNKESGAHLEKGIVSSRISLFHTISNVEDLPRKKSISHSMHNISDSPKLQNQMSISLTETSVTHISETGLLPVQPCFSDEELSIIQSSPTKDDNVLKKKRFRIKNDSFNKSFDETSSVANQVLQLTPQNKPESEVLKTVIDITKQSGKQERFHNIHTLRKSSVSKSEMDLFSRSKSNVSAEAEDFDRHKSYEELPKINVKNYISMYETVSESVKAETRQIKKLLRTRSIGSGRIGNKSMKSGDENTFSVALKMEDSIDDLKKEETNSNCKTPKPPPRRKRWLNKSMDSQDIGISMDSLDGIKDETVSEPSQNLRINKNKTLVTLSDIELEIISNSPDPVESSPERETHPTDYKSRFKLAKQYFQSLEELRVEPVSKASKKINECEELLLERSNESLVSEGSKNKSPKRGIKKSYSMPSSEISKIWKQMQKSEDEAKLVKISEKFHVDDLFNDVVEGKLSRKGSLRGIPHKKAVLEAFRSMENVTDAALSSYEISMSQLSEFAKENRIKNAQTYLSEYPYLPTTDPLKYHSRLDTKASGLICMKELLNEKPRRNSVPDIRLNPKFTVEL
ncbi:uncharacterized protein LOC105386365 isoform X1 [Plutella xylostella]|uniref:uncharacterized protein LOC105386365 isoform X1 n=2 Tax=Plutella xylostella TaxID=51655 RepID=UPI002032889D|nr:uncharacterized protein LOC105386365 isoform X1 [Plutella xylostella]